MYLATQRRLVLTGRARSASLSALPYSLLRATYHSRAYGTVLPEPPSFGSPPRARRTHLETIDVLRSNVQVGSKPILAMGAHNPLSAKLVENAGFDAVWVSSLEVSASYAVPDASIVPTSLPLELTRAMGEVQRLPLIIDMDSGYGNAVNVAYAAPRLEAAGAAAIVIEDKNFPKLNSLRPDAHHDLVSVEEFQGKIAAAKASSNMLVIARIEALIAGLGEAEALKRGEAYVEAGADAVLIHSKQKSPHEILSFCRAWSHQTPLVLVPTSYPQLTFAEIERLHKVGLIICANHGLRAAVAGMRSTFKRIISDQKLEGVEDDITPVKEIFALQGDDDVRNLEQSYVR